ncbi:MAG TPA: TIGR02594 family protein [Pyrinomonadaceae bacterium]|nr:TIGR02594 family protein [Pyrinomonadaceae bacterium]
MPDKYRVTATTLNLREGPSVTEDVIGFLTYGEVVELISKSGDGYWYKVKRTTGDEGWASHKYLELVVTSGTEEFPWMPIASAEQGVKEFPGSGDNPRIVLYLQSTNLPASLASEDETHWCSAFVNWCVEHSGFEGTDSAWAKSWATWGKKLTTPRRGCIAVFKRGVSSGHVAFYVGETSTHVKILGGNQSDAVTITKYPKSKLISYRVPG